MITNCVVKNNKISFIYSNDSNSNAVEFWVKYGKYGGEDCQYTDLLIHSTKNRDEDDNWSYNENCNVLKSKCYSRTVYDEYNVFNHFLLYGSEGIHVLLEKIYKDYFKE